MFCLENVIIYFFLFNIKYILLLGFNKLFLYINNLYFIVKYEKEENKCFKGMLYIDFYCVFFKLMYIYICGSIYVCLEKREKIRIMY